MNKFDNLGEFVEPALLGESIEEVAKVYGVAFAGPPWFEVTKCASSSTSTACPGGFSPLKIGEVCGTCNLIPASAAYPVDETVKRFEQISKSRQALWYIERANGRLALAAFAWKVSTNQLAAEKYTDVPGMKVWLNQNVGNEAVWLDEVFADLTNRTNGNLANFNYMLKNFLNRLGGGVLSLAFRTINKKMISAARRMPNARIFAANNEVPDRRDFVLITAAKGGAE